MGYDINWSAVRFLALWSVGGAAWGLIFLALWVALP